MIRGFQEVEKDQIKHRAIKTVLPRRATNESAGYDLHSKESIVMYPNQIHKFTTDVKAYMLSDEKLSIYTRSGNGSKRGIKVRNQVGIIDADYYENEDNDGNIIVCLENTGDQPFEVNIGDKIAQAIFTNYLITDDDNPVKQKRTGGLGHTGK